MIDPESKEYAVSLLRCLYDSLERYRAEGNKEWEYRTCVRIAYYRQKHTYSAADFRNISDLDPKPSADYSGVKKRSVDSFIRKNYRRMKDRQLARETGTTVSYVAQRIEELGLVRKTHPLVPKDKIDFIKEHYKEMTGPQMAKILDLRLPTVNYLVGSLGLMKRVPED